MNGFWGKLGKKIWFWILKTLRKVTSVRLIIPVYLMGNSIMCVWYAGSFKISFK